MAECSSCIKQWQSLKWYNITIEGTDSYHYNNTESTLGPTVSKTRKSSVAHAAFSHPIPMAIVGVRSS